MCWFKSSVLLTFALFSAVAATSMHTVNITNGEQLKEYLCSPKRTIAPNTHLNINNSDIEIANITNDCLVENTSNILITSSYFNSEYSAVLAVVYCSDSLKDISMANTFSFFNVTNLTISSVLFIHCGLMALPPAATKYINGSDQVFEYGDTVRTTFLLNHCYNVTLFNVFADVGYWGPVYNRTTVIGVNLCGLNNITSIIPRDLNAPLVTLSIYYVDSDIMSEDAECALHIQSNMLSAHKHNNIVQFLKQGAAKFPVVPYRDLAVIAAQEKFRVDINLEILPKLYETGMQSCTSVLIMFINDENNTRITFQGYPYEFCTDPTSIPLPHNPYWPMYRPIHLDVIFYGTSSHRPVDDGILSPVLIRNTSFIYYRGLDTYEHLYEDNHVVHILQHSVKMSYSVEFEKTAWCNNSIFFDVFRGDDNWCNQLLAQGPEYSNHGLHLKMNDVFIKNNLYDNYDYKKDDRLKQRFSGSMMLFINTDVTISGNSYVGQNFGGSAISAVSSNVTITGDLTIRDGYSYYGGGIRLDNSYLFLKEPLHAQFINNSAKQGSAIYAPTHTSTLGIDHPTTISPIQIWPNDVYTSENLTSIDISLNFSKIGLNTSSYSPSLYAPSFGFTDKQISPFLHFNDDTYHPPNSSYHLTKLIDTIIESDDKFVSLSNGYCVEIYREKNCSYSDELRFEPVYRFNHVTVYPGEMAVSLPCHDNKQYLMLYADNVIQQLSCETKLYEYWNTSLTFDSLSFTFSGNTNADFSIIQISSEFHTPVPFLTVKVRFNQCPLGFEMNSWGVCVCADPLLKLNFECNINTRNITSPPYHWTGLKYKVMYDPHIFKPNVTYILLSTNCPPGYCSNNVSMKLSDFHDSSFPCLNNRSGILCGQCKDNLSVLFGSDECLECSHLYLLTLPVYAVAGLLLVVLLFALRLTVATGTINGLIFYANILDLSMDVFSQGITKFHVGPLRIIISLLNLNLGFPLCLYDGMTTAAKAGLQFIFPVYLWSIVVGLIIAARYSTRLSNVFSQSSVQVLATLFYLSFSKLVQATVYIVSSSTIFSIEAVEVDPIDHFYGYITDNYTIWLYDGMPYNTGIHCFLLVIIFMFAVFFILPYTILLTFSQCLVRFKLINKIRPFLDAYGGPFKDKWRFWFGLRLWVIVILLSINGALQGSNVDIMLLAHFVIIQLFILLQAHVMPFQSRAVGLLDVSFMVNYLLIVLFYLQFANTDIMTFHVVYILLVSFIVLVFFLIVLCHFLYCCVFLKNSNYFAMLKHKVANRFEKYDVVINENAAAEDSDEGLFEAAEEREPIIDTY